MFAADRLFAKFGVKVAGALILVGGGGPRGLVATVGSHRALLACGEAPIPRPPSAIAMWFPQKERALATGIFNSGTSVGVIVSGGVVASLPLGLESAFVSVGVMGLLWLIFWQKFFNTPEKRPRVCAGVEYIKAGYPGDKA
jgi:ACS family hexuronate transporter-like MFS transporter